MRNKVGMNNHGENPATIASGQPLAIVGGKYNGKRAVARMCKGKVTTEKMIYVTIDQGPNRDKTDTCIMKANVDVTTTLGWSQHLLHRLSPNKELTSNYQGTPTPSARNDSTRTGRNGSILQLEIGAMQKQFDRVIDLVTEDAEIEVGKQFFEETWKDFLGILNERIRDELQNHAL
jgi:hypothetical protein